MNLQEDWDTCLLNGFYKYPDCNSYHLQQQFLVAHELTEEDAKSIKRMPKGYAQGKITVLRFICAYLPKIADILWKHNGNEIEHLAKAMSKSNYDTREEMADLEKWNKEVGEIRRGKRENVVNKMKVKEIDKLYDAYRRSSTWGVTK